MGSMERLNADLKSGQFKQIYLLFGEETFLRKNYRDSLKKAIIGDDTMNYTYFEGKDTDPVAVKDMGETLPFFSEKRLIIVENTEWNSASQEIIVSFLEKIPDYLYIIFVEPSCDKRTRFFKTCGNLGSAVEMKPLTGDKQKYWITGILNKYGKKMRENDIIHLISLTGDDMVNIKSEIEKLVNYVGEREVITSEDVDAIVTRRIEDHIFKMVDSMGRREQRRALEYYYELLARKESPFRILSLVVRQFNILIQTKELVMLRTPEKTIAQKIGVNSFFIRDYIVQASNFSMEKLREALEACARADEDIKMGKMTDKLSVELLIVEFSK